MHKVQRCKICHCTDDRGCSAGCSRVEEDLCSTCALILEALVEYADVCFKWHPNVLIAEAKAAYAEESLLNAQQAGKQRTVR
jgi:hypothetical protein